MEFERNINSQNYENAKRVIDQDRPISQAVMEDYKQSKAMVDGLDTENILTLARNIIFQLLNQLPEFEVNNTNFGNSRTHDFPDRNIVACRAMVTSIFSSTARYLLNLVEEKFHKDFDKYASFMSVGEYPYCLNFTDINCYLNDTINSGNIGLIAGTVVYKNLISLLEFYYCPKNLSNYKSTFELNNEARLKLEEYINLLDGVLNCLGYFAWECRPLMFNNIRVKIPKSFYHEDDASYCY